MLNLPLLYLMLFAWLLPSEPPVHIATEASVPVAAVPISSSVDAVSMEAIELYDEIGLNTTLASGAFVAAYSSAKSHGSASHILAIADMTRPSTEERLFLIDLEKRILLLRTWVAHGSASGELYAETFSNKSGSHQTSLGLYRVGAEIVSPKHGAALLLHGLDARLNGAALEREVIMHGATYVSAEFIAEHGRCGRSWGCPTVSKAHMQQMIDLLADGGLLFVYGGH